MVRWLLVVVSTSNFGYTLSPHTWCISSQRLLPNSTYVSIVALVSWNITNGKRIVSVGWWRFSDKEIDVIDEDCFVHCPPISKTKGRPKQKRMKGGRELGKQKKTCRLCKHIGHNISTCPEKNNSTSSSNGTNRRKKMT